MHECVTTGVSIRSTLLVTSENVILLQNKGRFADNLLSCKYLEYYFRIRVLIFGRPLRLVQEVSLVTIWKKKKWLSKNESIVLTGTLKLCNANLLLNDMWQRIVRNKCCLPYRSSA